MSLHFTRCRSLGSLCLVVVVSTLWNSAGAATCGRYRVTRTDKEISEVLLLLLSGGVEHTDDLDLDLEALSDVIEIDLSSIKATIRSPERVIRLEEFITEGLERLDLQKLLTDMKRQKPVHTMIGRFLETSGDEEPEEGSIEYSYSGWVRGIHAHRYTLIEDNHLRLELTLTGQMQRLTWAKVIIDARHTKNNDTVIKGTIFAHAPTKCRCVTKIAERRVMPPLIDQELERIENRARELAEDGKSGFLVSMVEAAKRISEQGLGSGR